MSHLPFCPQSDLTNILTAPVSVAKFSSSHLCMLSGMGTTIPVSIKAVCTDHSECDHTSSFCGTLTFEQ